MNYPWIAIILGYPILAVWFWCTDQSMVQSVLGAKNLNQGQLGANFTGWLKILDIPLFILPGILCFVLFPELDNPDEAYMTMVTRLFPVGMRGLVMAVLIAALISTIDSALNSLSTVFTMDIYLKKSKTKPTQRKIIKTGRFVTLIGSLISVFLATLIANVEGLNLFDLFQAILGFLAPPMTAVFLSGVLWKKTSTKAVNIALVAGTVFSLSVGIMYLFVFPASDYNFWPHFLLLSFYIYSIIQIQIIVVSIFGKVKINNDFNFIEKKINDKPSKKVKILWGGLIVLMGCLYIFFNGHKNENYQPLIDEENSSKNTHTAKIIEINFKDSTSMKSFPVDSLVIANKLDSSSILKWNNHLVFLQNNILFHDKFINDLKSLSIGNVKTYTDVIYEFDRSSCNDFLSDTETKQHLLSVNLVKDKEKQQEYINYHTSQKDDWPELSQGFCNEGFQSLTMYKQGRQIMLLITIPRENDLGEMSAKNSKNNPKVKEWDDIMYNYQEGLPGTKQNQKWVLFE